MKNLILYGLLITLFAALLGACGQVPATQPAPTPTSAPVPPTPEPTAAPQAAGERVVYDANEFFTLEYPAGWEVVNRPEQNSVLFLTPPAAGDEDRIRENVGVMRQPLADPDTTLGSYTRDFLAAAPNQIENYQLVTSEPVKLSGLPAHRVVYAGSQNGVPLGWLQVWTISDGSAYILTYTGDPVEFNTFLPDADAIIASFTLK